jgi:hypothetical protein
LLGPNRHDQSPGTHSVLRSPDSRLEMMAPMKMPITRKTCQSNIGVFSLISLAKYELAAGPVTLSAFPATLSTSPATCTRELEVPSALSMVRNVIQLSTPMSAPTT